MEDSEAESSLCNSSDVNLRSTSPDEHDDECIIKENNKGPFNDPVYKELSRINGEINDLTTEELISKLAEFHLETRGTKEVIKKRLKAFYKEKKLAQALAKKHKSSNCPYKYLCIVDFEATCDADTNYPHEIIEFPAILLDTADKTIVAEFHKYCRPLMNLKLTEFCVSLTGISQEIVDKADTFPDVLNEFTRWMESYSLGVSNSFAIVTDGSCDMGQFLVMQCNYSDIPFPNFGKKWINIRKIYSNFYRTKRVSIPLMLENLGMTFEGRQHCGLDDARNIAHIVIQMLKDGANLRINERLKWNSLPCRFADDGYYKGAVPECGDNDKNNKLSHEKNALQTDVENQNADKIATLHKLCIRSQAVENQ